MIVEPKDNFLQEVKELTHKNGAILIFDEIVTGFRLALGGAQEYFGVIPDLATFGKGMANGMPLSAIVGNRDIMKEFTEVFFSCTFGGEVLSLAAATATIKELKEKNAIDHFRKQGEKLKHGYNELAQSFGLFDYTQCIGVPEHSAFYFKDTEGNDSLEMKSLFQQELIKGGILSIGVHLFCLSHNDEDVQKTLGVYRDAMSVLRQAIDEGNIEKYLVGTKVGPAIRKHT